MIGDVQEVNGVSVRNITFSPFSTANTGRYMCSTQTNTATTTVTPNGMIIIIYFIYSHIYTFFLCTYVRVLPQYLFPLHISCAPSISVPSTHFTYSLNICFLPLVPEPNPTISPQPPAPTVGNPLTINCNAAVPSSLAGAVGVLRILKINADGSTTLLAQGPATSPLSHTIPNAQQSDGGTYRCEIEVTSNQLLTTPSGTNQPLVGLTDRDVPQPACKDGYIRQHHNELQIACANSKCLMSL